MAEERSLPGWPKKKLVKEVRRHLSSYGIRPVKFTIWQATWSWADAIAHSYFHVHWPLPSEIGTQYILLLLVEMQQSHLLRLPYRARESMPRDIEATLHNLHQHGFPAFEFGAARVRAKGKALEESGGLAVQRKMF